MVRVTIELDAHGLGDSVRMLGVMEIVNDGTGTGEFGNYTYTLSHAGKFFGKRSGPFKKGRVKNFKRTLSPYRLVCRCLKDAMEV